MTEIDQFQTHRPALFAVAYRMLGSATDAEDVLQDAWLRFAGARPADLRSAKAYLTTIVTRLCLDRLKSARATREEYVGPWLPEPVVTSERPGPERSLAQAESVTLAFMVLLETLSPEERARRFPEVAAQPSSAVSWAALPVQGRERMVGVLAVSYAKRDTMLFALSVGSLFILRRRGGPTPAFTTPGYPWLPPPPKPQASAPQ